MRYSLVLLLLACAIGALFASPVLAAPEGGAANPLDILFDTALWSVVIFIALLLILHKYAWGPVLEGLQKREETIRSSLEEAKQTRDEMAKLKADFQKEMAETQQQIPKLMEDARKDAELLKNEMRTAAAAEIQAERERLRREIETAKDQAIKELWEQAAQLATLISAKAIGRSLSEDDHRRLIDESLQEMSRERR